MRCTGLNVQSKKNGDVKKLFTDHGDLEYSQYRTASHTSAAVTKPEGELSIIIIVIPFRPQSQSQGCTRVRGWHWFLDVAPVRI